MNQSTSLPLEGKVALVTGGGTGIGLAIAQYLARAGARVVISGRRAGTLQAAAEADPEARLSWRVCDVTDRPSVRDLVDHVQFEHGVIDILVCAAGVNIKNRAMADVTAEQWDEVLAINATGAFNAFHFVLPQMRQRRTGIIINISSIAGKRAIALGGIPYCASKFAATALGTAVGTEVAADGVRVTNVYPGEVDTPILENRPTPVTPEHRQRILQPQDVAELVLSICLLPPRAHVPEVVIKPIGQNYV